MLRHKVFLTQTDTTIGFVSQNKAKLDTIKQRPSSKHYITAVDSLSTLKHFTRIPILHRSRVRRTKKTTFIMPNNRSYRLIKDSHHLLLLKRLKWAYTTSANLSGLPYDEAFAKKNADVIIEPFLHKAKASTIYKLGHKNIKKVR